MRRAPGEAWRLGSSSPGAARGPAAVCACICPRPEPGSGEGQLGAAASENRKACLASKNLLFPSAWVSALQRGSVMPRPYSGAAGARQAPRVGVGLVHHPTLSLLAGPGAHGPHPAMGFHLTAAALTVLFFPQLLRSKWRGTFRIPSTSSHLSGWPGAERRRNRKPTSQWPDSYTPV